METKKIYVGNIPFSATEEGLREIFGIYGEVEDVKLISDRETGRSKGFGFISFSASEEAAAACEANGKEVDGRKLRVDLAQERPPRSGGPGGGGGGRGGFRGGNRGGGGGGYRR